MPYPYQSYNYPNGYGQQNYYQQPQYMQQQARDGIIRVTGMEGARAYQMPPNSREALFDDTDDIVIIKVTDGAGFPSFKRAQLLWLDDSAKQAPAGDYITREEFMQWKEEMEHAQQAIRRRSRAAEHDPAAAENDGA